MSVILSHLGINKKDLKQDRTWIFSDTLKKKNFSFFKGKIAKHASYKFLYKALITKFCDDFNTLPEKALCMQAEELLAFAQYLKFINLSYLKSYIDAKEFSDDIKFFKRFLLNFDYNFADDDPDISTLGFEKNIRNYTLLYNWPRNFVIRSRRFFLSLDLCLTDYITYHKTLLKIEKFSLPIVTYIAWIFFAPRLFVNIFNFLKHTIPGFWMDDKEREIGIQERISAQIPERWFELANDCIWFTGGILNCFLFVGSLAVGSFYLLFYLQAYDVVASSIRLYVETRRMQEISSIYKNDDKTRKYLANQTYHEQKKLTLLIFQNSFLLLSLGLILPFFANPIMGLVGASLLVITTIVCFVISLYLENHAPMKKLSDISDIKDNKDDTVELTPLLKQSMFHRKDLNESNEPELICNNYQNSLA